MLMNDEIARALIKDCYMYLLNFSFDAATKETLESIRRGARYETVLANIEKVKRAKMDAGAELPCLAIRFAAMKRNIHELPSLVDLAKKVGIEKITVEYLLVTEETPPEESLFFHQNLARRYFQEAAVKAQEKGIVLELPEPMDTKLQTPRKCDMPWTFIKIDTDGTARFCYKSWDRPIGNVLKVNDFKELWNCPRYQAIRKTVNTQEPFFLYCKICSARWGRSEAYHHIQKPSEAVAGLYCFKGEKGSG
jgi:MoaA/NifB/PqqE/SkfB family radical SAM enzyme